jgi:hypothetical protein
MLKIAVCIVIGLSDIFGCLNAKTKDEPLKNIVDSIQFIINDMVYIDSDKKQLVKTKFCFDYDYKDSTLTFIQKNGNNTGTFNQDTLSRIITCHLNDLHSKGFFIKQYQKGRFYLLIMLENNVKRFLSVNYFNGEKKESAIQNNFAIGPLDSISNYNNLKKLKTKFEALASYSSNNIDKYKPDIDICNVVDYLSYSSRSEYDYTNMKNYNIYFSHAIDNPPLFAQAKSFSENEKLVEQFIYLKLDEKHIKIKFIAGDIRIDEEGKVEDFYDQDSNSKYKKAIKEIILSMPKWKPGVLKGAKVKTLYTLYFKL